MENNKDNMSLGEQVVFLEKQIDELAKFLLQEFDKEMGNKGKGEGAIEMAMRLLNKYKILINN